PRPPIRPLFPSTTLFRPPARGEPSGAASAGTVQPLPTMPVFVQSPPGAVPKPIGGAVPGPAASAPASAPVAAPTPAPAPAPVARAEEHTAELQSRENLVC